MIATLGRLSRGQTALAWAVAVACSLLAGCGGSEDQRATPTTPERSGTPLRPATLATMTPPVRGAIRQARRDLHAGGARREVFRGRRAVALRVLTGREPLVDQDVVIVTFAGRIDYRAAVARPGDTTRVSGRFAYVMLDPHDGSRLELGVLNGVPFGLR